jgi:hypothetical protein
MKYTKAFDNKEYDTVDLLNDCYRMTVEARRKLHKHSEYQLHIVLPVDDLRALRYALAQDVILQIGATGTTNYLENRLFDCILHESRILDKVIVY